MPCKSFVIPAMNADWAENELNQFLQSHRVLAVDRQWVDRGENSFWAVWVDYLEMPGEKATGFARETKKKGIDYRDVLSPEDFEVFIRLRKLRKEISEQDGVAVYNVLTNEQLSQIVQARSRTTDDLRQIAGIGDARIEKYGPRVLELLNQIWKEGSEKGGEAAGADSGTK